MHRTARIVATVAALAGLTALLLAGVDEWPGQTAIILGDCEHPATGLTVQPIAAWTSLAFVPAGVWVAGHPQHRPAVALLFGAGLIAVGLGSFAGHASGTTWGRQLDSLAIKAMLAPFILYPLLREKGAGTIALTCGAAAAALVAIELAFPSTGRVLLALMVAALVAVLFSKHDPRMLLPGVAVLAVGAAAWWLGRSGGALCRPDGLLQVHAAWHILAAGGLTLLYRAIHAH